MVSRSPFQFDSWYWWGYAEDYTDIENQPAKGFALSPKPYAPCKVCKLKWSECKCNSYQPRIKKIGKKYYE